MVGCWYYPGALVDPAPGSRLKYLVHKCVNAQVGPTCFTLGDKSISREPASRSASLGGTSLWGSMWVSKHVSQQTQTTFFNLAPISNKGGILTVIYSFYFSSHFDRSWAWKKCAVSWGSHRDPNRTWFHDYCRQLSTWNLVFRSYLSFIGYIFENCAVLKDIPYIKFLLNVKAQQLTMLLGYEKLNLQFLWCW